MQQIAGWLEKLGLAQYAARFAENDINFAILSDLTDQDLKELGVSSLGHRRQLLRAIAELNTVEQGTPKLAPATAAPETRQPNDGAERRQLTVMFCDLAGSTALSARLDPEDMREIVGAYHRSCAEQIAKAGGFVAKYMGDGVETTKEKWCEAEVHRVAGEIALKSSEPDATKAQAYFERAISIARTQQAKSWELRAATSLAQLWSDQGKRQQALDILAPIYGWFTEGFDTLDLKEARALLDELHA